MARRTSFVASILFCWLNPVQVGALQMNAGAEQAKGDILLFLHADTTLPVEFANQLRGRFLALQKIAGDVLMCVSQAIMQRCA